MTIHSTPPLPPELAEKLERVMAQRPATSAICCACWAAIHLGSEFAPSSCACRREPSTGIEARLRWQQEREPTDADMQGLDDNRAAKMLALRARATSGTEPERTADEQSVLDTLVRVGGRPLTREEEWLALEQARAVGMLE
jgi:hypothetical protein